MFELGIKVTPTQDGAIIAFDRAAGGGGTIEIGADHVRGAGGRVARRDIRSIYKKNEFIEKQSRHRTPRMGGVAGIGAALGQMRANSMMETAQRQGWSLWLAYRGGWSDKHIMLADGLSEGAADEIGRRLYEIIQ